MRKGSLYTLDDYHIASCGKIINKHNNHILKPQYNKSRGYLQVYIGHKKHFVHRLVATKYIPNPENKPQVNHIDGNKSNNVYTNLEWVTNGENQLHKYKMLNKDT